jgi:hypothetical protein
VSCNGITVTSCLRPPTTFPRFLKSQQNKRAITMAISTDKNDASGAGSRIKGNLSLKLKQQLEAGMYGIMARSDIYGASIGKRVVVTEASIVPKAEEASRTEARVVCEITVEEGSAAFSEFGSICLLP